MQTRQIIDFARSERRYTDEGFLIVPARIARTGIQLYRAFELGITDGDPMRIIRVYRSPEEVFAPEAMASFENKPVTDNHPEEFVDASNWKELSIGFARNIRRDGNYLMADLVVTDREGIEKIESGKVELSNGYDAFYDWTPGNTADGEPYDAQQKTIRGNHVALVDAARCGPACRVSDSTRKGVKPMAVKMTIDGIPFDLEEAAAAAVDKLTKARDAAVSASAKAGEDLAKAQASHAEAIKAKDTEIEALKRDVMTPDQRDAMVEAWAKLTADAKRLAPNFDHKGKTCDAIRREVVGSLAADEKRKPIIDAILAGRALESVDGETIKTLFNVLAAQPAADADHIDHTPDPVAEALKRNAKDSDPGTAGRSAYMQRLADAWKSPANPEQE